jgi:hypothetical protein
MTVFSEDRHREIASMTVFLLYEMSIPKPNAPTRTCTHWLMLFVCPSFWHATDVYYQISIVADLVSIQIWYLRAVCRPFSSSQLRRFELIGVTYAQDT